VALTLVTHFSTSRNTTGADHLSVTADCVLMKTVVVSGTDVDNTLLNIEVDRGDDWPAFQQCRVL